MGKRARCFGGVYHRLQSGGLDPGQRPFHGLSLKSLKGLVNPGFLSTIVGVLFYVCKVVLPAPVLATVTQLGNVNTLWRCCFWGRGWTP